MIARNPLDVLDRCHERIRQSCAEIERLAARLAAGGADDEARDAAETVLGDLDAVAARHHHDEEDDLFPALRQHVPREEAGALESLISQLEDEHETLDVLWHDMRIRLAGIAGGHPVELRPDVARSFASVYERHIALEDVQLLPLARRILDPDRQRALGEAMARRREAGRA